MKIVGDVEVLLTTKEYQDLMEFIHGTESMPLKLAFTSTMMLDAETYDRYCAFLIESSSDKNPPQVTGTLKVQLSPHEFYKYRNLIGLPKIEIYGDFLYVIAPMSISDYNRLLIASKKNYYD